MPAPNQITVSQLNRLIGTPDCPILVDVCIDEDFEDDAFLIPGSFRHPFNDIEGLADRLRDKRAVIICQKGKKLSQGVVACLQHEGISAEALEGGMFAWRDAGMPRIPHDAMPPRDAKGRTVWVTRLRPKIDRIACPWLIRRFIDPSAVFLYVTAQEVDGVAERFNATPFDIDGVFWSHRGDRCTFDTMIEEFKLGTEALERFAAIIRGADTDRHDMSPQCAGLMAASLGLSRMYRDDLAQLEAGLLLYDAFYRWCRDASDETHDWPGSRSAK
ncbi:chromate resistance protein ChrB domain-containing protein [Roseibium sp.]|uniref:chromate resistance protein ChrB domain-containing protein n=1 Tax=Roseibium sp. TaxID=1936156 RepID=UPI003A970729